MAGDMREELIAWMIDHHETWGVEVAEIVPEESALHDRAAALLRQLADRADHSAGVGEKVSDALREFARWAIRNSSFEGCDLDGGSVQDKAVELGLITQFDVTEACGDDCRCAEYGFPSVCCRFSDALAQPADADAEGAK